MRSKSHTKRLDAMSQAAVLLDIIKSRKTDQATSERNLAEEINHVKKKYQAVIGYASADIEAAEKALIKLMRKNKETLFNASGSEMSTRRDLPGGHALVYSAVRRVKRTRGILNLIKLSGLKQLVRVKESADWDGINDLDDDLLVQLKTERVLKELFSYELRGLPCD